MPENALIGLAALESTDWTRLYHAYGPATDTPGHLRALLGEDAKAREKAVTHLWSAIIHQGTPWTATGPVARVIAGLLSDARLDQGEPVRANLLSFLAEVVDAPARLRLSSEELERMAAFDIEPFIDAGDEESLYGGGKEEICNSFYARSILGCIAAAPILMGTIGMELDHSDARVRACAAMGVAVLIRVDSMHRYARQIELEVLALARAAQHSDERSAHVLALGDLGHVPREFLQDPSPAVRMCAALAPGLADDPAATRELIRALEQAEALDGWFTQRPPQFSMHPRFTVVARLVERVRNFEYLADAAEAVVRVTEKYAVDGDWGPLLAAAFPDGQGRVTTEAQRRFLRALVGRAELWDPRFENPQQWFRRAGLPYDRQLCAERAALA